MIAPHERVRLPNLNTFLVMARKGGYERFHQKKKEKRAFTEKIEKTGTVQRVQRHRLRRTIHQTHRTKGHLGEEKREKKAGPALLLVKGKSACYPLLKKRHTYYLFSSTSRARERKERYDGT